MIELEVTVTNRDETRKSILGYLRRDIKSMPMLSGLLQGPVLLTELGFTAIGLIVAIIEAGRWRWLGDLTNGGDDLGWPLVIDVVLALWLAARFERRRWIRNVSVIFHVALVILVLLTLVGFYTNPND